MGEDDPRTLVHTLVYLFGKNSSLRSGEEYKDLRFSQLEVIEGDLVERTRLKDTSLRKRIMLRITALLIQGKSRRTS